MYVFHFPATLACEGKNILVYTDEVKKDVEKEKAIMLMMALMKKNIPYEIFSPSGEKIKPEAIIPREKFWERYFSRNFSGKEAEEILLR